ncbi:TIGR03086 family metal-binding protein [Streptomyces sp. SID3343]|uniref:TIGR03086 family metal-binding protein n=1 Tax=Streptomyces sp. SID3343 TaxID=2690260 RepID=UPI00136F3034|nr:TIGR03086 family metal-binding protein [Streptomyces sp. SID3343]MYW03110.1 TIGR03086 family protein [Streptomyces sp. SID3343]
MNIHPLLVEASAEAERLARNVVPEQLSGPTPCAEFDTRTLINHWVLYTSHGLEHRALRKPMSEELTARDFAAEPDWAASYAVQLRRAVGAWAQPQAWEGEVDLGGGSMMPAAEIAAMVLKEMVVHGWDVAEATGQEYHASPELEAAIEKIVAQYAEIYREYKGFAEPVRTPEGATALERALAMSGRDPGWRG